MEEPRQPNAPKQPRELIINLSLPRVSRKRLLIAAVILVCAGGLAFATISYLRQNTGALGIPDSISSRVSFPLYFPKNPPAELKLDGTSFTATNQVLTYSYTYEGSKRLIVSIQPRPQDLEAVKFNATKDYTTHIGHAYIVDLEMRTTGAVVADSLILVNAPQKIAAETMEQFLNSLRPARK